MQKSAFDELRFAVDANESRRMVYVHGLLNDLSPKHPVVERAWIGRASPALMPTIVKALQSAPKIPDHLRRIRSTHAKPDKQVFVILSCNEHEPPPQIPGIEQVFLASVPASVPRPGIDPVDEWHDLWPCKISTVSVIPETTRDQQRVIDEFMVQVTSTGSHTTRVIIYDPERKRICGTGYDVMDAIRSQSRDSTEWSKKTERASQHYYFCTGCWCFSEYEPSIKEAMALVHSRVAQVVYAKPDNLGGGLGSCIALHCERRLNHRFHVWLWTKPQSDQRPPLPQPQDTEPELQREPQDSLEQAKMKRETRAEMTDANQ
eukprot:ANDGO_08535.mRNA.1 tRNA-specific adenosine deaminase subunit tad3